MAIVTNLTNLTGATTVYEIVKYTNDITGDIMGYGFILVTFVILTSLFLGRNYEFPKAVLVSSFLCLLLSIPLTAIELLNFFSIIFFAVIMVLDGFLVYFQR